MSAPKHRSNDHSSRSPASGGSSRQPRTPKADGRPNPRPNPNPNPKAHRGASPRDNPRPDSRRGSHGARTPNSDRGGHRGSPPGDDRTSPRDAFLPGAVRIVHEDADLLVVDKPTGMLTVPPPNVAPGDDFESLFARVKRHVRDQAKRRGTKVWIIHRLDKEASGLLVFAKSERAFASLKEEFRTKRAHRLYCAVVEGEIHSGMSDGRAHSEASGTIRSFLVEGEDGRVRSVPSGGRPAAGRSRGPMGAAGSRGGGGRDDGPPRKDFGALSPTDPKLAVTHYRVRAAARGMSLVQVRLESGRKHQIRVHMSEMKHPIVGDGRYGAASDPISRVCLHAFELGFHHPGTGEPLRFRSEIPPAFFRLVGRKAAESGHLGAGDGSEDHTSGPGPESAPGSAPGSAAAEHRRNDAAPPAPAPRASPRNAGWDHVAEWYDELIEDRKSDHHERVIIPGILRLAGPREGDRVIDIACGQGAFCRVLAQLGAEVLGIDSSPKLIDAAVRSSRGPAGPRFAVADARSLRDLQPDNRGPFDHATCVMALMNIEPLSPVLAGVASVLRPGGTFTAVILHPAFRAPGQTSWGFEEQRSASRPGRPDADADRRGRGTPVHQYRRVDGYLSPGHREIVMNPGAVSSGETPIVTETFHRPIQAYVKAYVDAGLVVDALEEWPSARLSEPGPRAAEENRARREIPMFLAVRGRKVGGDARDDGIGAEV